MRILLPLVGFEPTSPKAATGRLGIPETYKTLSNVVRPRSCVAARHLTMGWNARAPASR
jgi:hypothetical protein